MSSAEEVRLAVRHGADALGFVSAMPSGPGVIDERLIATLVRLVPPAVATFLLTCLDDPDAIAAQQRRCGTNTLQLCDRMDRAAYSALRRALPGVHIVQVIHVTDAASVAEAQDIAPFVDAILLDSGNQTLAVKELGGTGRTHDWTLSGRIRESIAVPLFLAGGLRSDNVADGVVAVRPFGVDVCSGVRSEGRLDETKLAGFVAAVRASERLSRLTVSL